MELKISYSAAVNKDLSDVVKSAMTESISCQRENNKASYTIAIYSLSERKTDQKDIYGSLLKIGSEATICNSRIGRMKQTMANEANNKVKPRPIRIELLSLHE